MPEVGDTLLLVSVPSRGLGFSSADDEIEWMQSVTIKFPSPRGA